MNLRFAGQYYDSESKTHYNYFRDYDPAIGRYIQTDPIGLYGGINTFGYVGQNPLLFVDPYGLYVQYVSKAVRACATNPTCSALVATSLKAAYDACQATGEALNNWWNSDAEPENADKPGKTDAPPLPDTLVGEGQRKPKKEGGRVTSGQLKPEHGGTGNADDDFDILIGGKGNRSPAGDRYPPGTLIGPNRIVLRPGNSSGGVSIDIPAKGGKPRETLHY